MEFKLNNYHRNVSDEALIKDLVAISIMIKKETVSREEYNKYGQYHSSTIERRFVSWSNALKKAGLSTFNEQNNICSSLEEFVNDVKRITNQLQKKTLTTGEYKQYGNFQLAYPFSKGKSWNDILKLANLEQTHFRLGNGKKITNEELFSDIERVWRKLGRQPTITDVKNGYFNFSQNTFCRRFGGWRNTLIAFVNYINSEEDANTTDTDDQVKDGPLLSNEPINKKRGKREPNLRMRFRIMERDHFKCCICGRNPATDPSVQLVIDHIHPWAHGGETTYENLRTLCAECNLGKSDLIPK